MQKVAVVGAGELGATVAARLAARDWGGEVVLVGADGAQARGKALDLLQSNPIFGSGTRIEGRDLEGIEGASWIVAAGPADPGGEQEIDGDPVEMLAAAGRLARDAVVIVAGNEPAPLLHAASAQGGFPPACLIGSAPAALASIWRLHLGRALGCSPQHVAVSIVGAPPADGLYEVFASVAGIPVGGLLGPAEERAVARRVRERSRPGVRSLASAAVRLLEDMFLKNGAIHPCYAWSSGAYGARNVFMSAPAVLGAHGIERILELTLEPAQRVTIDRAVDHLDARKPRIGSMKGAWP